MKPQFLPNPAASEIPLRDIHLPAPVEWWPPAPGWWITMLLFTLALALLFRWYHTRKNRQKIYISALNELRQIESKYRDDHDDLELVRALSKLIRRTAMTVHSRDQVAGLTGDDWLQFLDRGLDDSVPGQAFSRGVGRCLVEAPYNPHAAIDHQALLGLSRHWLVNVTRNKGTTDATV
jgi:hypothetical protein